jgi:hypothetical protein
MMKFLFNVPNPDEVILKVQDLIKNGEYLKAERLIQKSEKKNIFHDELSLLRHKLFGLMGNLQAQETELKHFFAQKEGDVMHHLQVVESLIKDSNWLLAQKVLDQIKTRFPLSGFTHSIQAKIHCHQENFEEAAISLLKKQGFKLLDDGDITLVHQIRRGALKMQQQGNPSAINTLLTTDQVKRILTRYYYERFESLGGDCEFGFHQRRHGREPLSLFRWGGMPRESMIRLFKNQFQDFATPQSATLKSNAPTLESSTDSLEYYFNDLNYDYMAHTAVGKKSKDFFETEEEVFKRLQPHFLMLARKLHEDLEDAEKGFVFKSRPQMSQQQCIEFHDALCSIGNTKLTIVMLKEVDKPNIEILRPNLIVARVSAWWDIAQLNNNDPATNEWDNIIQTSFQHFMQHYPEMDVV